ncbi:MAG: RNA polymerase sigma factor [Muribaculaceae bacterium]|nr:RNA polymerase sigma factor [Muribaculaceae bacterium]
MSADEFKRIFLPCHQRLYRLAFRLTGCSSNAEDLVQDAFLKMWDRRSDLRTLDSPEAYALTILKNIFIDTTRRRHIEFSGDDDTKALQVTSEIDLAEQIEWHDNASLVNALIAKLPENQRRVMRMRDIADFSFEEIETATGLSQANIRTLLCRARKQVKQQFIALMNYERK